MLEDLKTANQRGAQTSLKLVVNTSLSLMQLQKGGGTPAHKVSTTWFKYLAQRKEVLRNGRSHEWGGGKDSGGQGLNGKGEARIWGVSRRKLKITAVQRWKAIFERQGHSSNCSINRIFFFAEEAFKWLVTTTTNSILKQG